jgi:hypothetical protein
VHRQIKDREGTTRKAQQRVAKNRWVLDAVHTVDCNVAGVFAANSRRLSISPERDERMSAWREIVERTNVLLSHPLLEPGALQVPLFPGWRVLRRAAVSAMLVTGVLLACHWAYGNQERVRSQLQKPYWGVPSRLSRGIERLMVGKEDCRPGVKLDAADVQGVRRHLDCEVTIDGFVQSEHLEDIAGDTDLFLNLHPKFSAIVSNGYWLKGRILSSDRVSITGRVVAEHDTLWARLFGPMAITLGPDENEIAIKVRVQGVGLRKYLQRRR